MKQILIITALITLSFTSNAQSQIDSNNIYIQALTEHLEYLRSFSQNRPNLIKIPDVYYIEYDEISTINFPTEIYGQNIELLTEKEIFEKVKGKNSITLLAIRPIKWKNGQLEIHIIEFVVSGNKRKLNFINMMNGSSFRVKCSSDCQNIEIERFEL